MTEAGDAARPAGGSVTINVRNLEEARARDAATRGLWDRYSQDLVRYALRQIRAVGAARGITDEEDAALAAFAKVCRAIEGGTLKVGNRDDL
jgi:hypothetical protein